jgi:cyclase
MLKKRVIAFLPLKNGRVVQSFGFMRYLPIGDPKIVVEFLDAWGIDEIVLVDIEAGKENRCVDIDWVSKISSNVFVPITVGGGITSVHQIKQLLSAGADKILINHAAYQNRVLITEAAKIFGEQCIVASVDVVDSDDGHQVVFSAGKIESGLNPVPYSKTLVDAGAGEIILNSINRDGSMLGYDLALAKNVSDAVDVPVVICGGAGHPDHFVQALLIETLSGVAAGNFFHHTEHSVITLKKYLYDRFPNSIRLDTYAHYDGSSWGDTGRLRKKSETVLETLMFEYHPKETI